MELSQIAAACCAVAGRDPSGIKITYIMINKRHHTRLFPANPRSMDADRNGNVLPGMSPKLTTCEFFYICF